MQGDFFFRLNGDVLLSGESAGDLRDAGGPSLEAGRHRCCAADPVQVCGVRALPFTPRHGAVV